MKRKDFLKKGMGMMSIIPILSACSKSSVDASSTTSDSTTTSGSTNGSSSSNCTVSNTETAGPFPTITPSSLVKTDMRGDRSGVKLTINITIKNSNSSCAALAEAMVDIWHCDAKGEYSEYGGSGMQATNYTAVHWLRARQTTSSAGLVTYTSIFPGWYSGRAPHIHVHVYNSAGTSLLITQIAFPKTTCDTVYTTASDYTAHGVADTTNEKDNVFSDGYTNELASLSGNITDGYILTFTAVAAA